jgi:hypothetical protein
MLVQLFAHLEAEITKVASTRQTLLEQMESKVKDLLTSGEFSTFF